MDNFTVDDLIALDLDKPNAMDLCCLTGQKGLSRSIKSADINRPGLALFGYFEEFSEKAIQIIGRGELSYLKSAPHESIRPQLEKMFGYKIPCIIFCNDSRPPKYFLDIASKIGIAILVTPLDSSVFSIRLIRALDEVFASTQMIHGVFVEVEGMGILIQGESGIGKSETALELLDRGHRLIADDSVMIKCINGNMLWGSGVKGPIEHHMEIRGLGIIDISRLYGMNSLSSRQQIEMVVYLEDWDPEKRYNRLGTFDETVTYLGVNIPCITLPVKQGRNIAIIIEVAVLDQRLKNQGIYTAREFNEDLLDWLKHKDQKRGML